MGQPVLIVQGGHYGSEAKGAIASYLGKTRGVDYAVRTGATNAGHTAYYRGRAYKMQQLPVGWTRPDTVLVIGAGALIDPGILDSEVAMVNRATGANVRERLRIDRRAGLHLPEHALRSKESGRHHAIGATGKGCSEALVDRIRGRGTGSLLFGDSAYSDAYDTCDTELLLNCAYDEGAQILLEGTQGQLLDLYLGPYPYTTHKQVGPAQWMLEAGLSPSLPTEIVMVARTYPIRVAGNSGPLPQETSWPIVARSLNRIRAGRRLPPLVSEDALLQFEQTMRDAAGWLNLPPGSDGLDQHTWTPRERLVFKEALSEQHRIALDTLHSSVLTDLARLFEMTTVTRKLRRVARLDLPTLRDSARQIRPAWVALTFGNYLWPEYWHERPEVLSESMRRDIGEIQTACRAPVNLITFGPDDCHVVATDAK